MARIANTQELQEALVAAHRAGDTANAARLARAIEEANKPEQPKLGVLGAIKGSADVAASAVRGTVNQLATFGNAMTGAVAGSIDPNRNSYEGYMQGKQQAQQAIQQGDTLVPDAALRTPEGQRVAEFIGQMPLVPRFGNPEGPLRVSDVGRGISNVSEGIKNTMGEPVADALGAGITLATLRSPTPQPVTPASLAVRTAQRSGYVVPPTVQLGTSAPGMLDRAVGAVTGTPTTGKPIYAGTVTDRAARNWGGGSDVDSRIAMRNQQITQQKAAEAAKLPEMTPQAHARAVASASSVYDTIKSLKGPGGSALTVPLSSQNYYNRVMSLAKTPGWNSAARLPDAVENLKNDLLSVHPTVEGVVNRVRQLREDSFKNFDGDAEAQMLGRAQREAADILDDELHGRLQFIANNASNPNLKSIASRIFDEYTNARASLAVLHDVRHAMNPTTGTIDASKLSRLVQDGRNVAPQLREVADAYNAFGGVGMQVAEKAAKSAGSPFGTSADLATGAIIGSQAGNLAGGGTGNVAGAIIGALAIPFSRYAAREYALRGPGARAVIGGVNNYVLKPGVTAGVVGSHIEDSQQ